MRADDAKFRADYFAVNQRFRLSTNVYEVLVDGHRVAWVRQKIMALRERVEIWTDDTQSELVCAIQGRQVVDLRGAYDVVDATGLRIGVLRKVFGRSLVRSTWLIERPDGEALARVTESSLGIAIVRRVKGLLDLVPVVGWALSLVPVPYGFTWSDPTSGVELGRYRRILGIRDRYELDLAGDGERRIDRRVAISMAICLDALQSR